MTIRSKHRRAFRKNAGGSRGRSKSKGNVAPERVYVPPVPSPVKSQELILIFLNEFFFNIVLILEPARINEIRRTYFLPWYNSCTPEQQRYWRILWGNPEVRLLIGDTDYADTHAGEFNTRNDAGRGILNHRITMSLVFLVILYHFAIAGATATNEYNRKMGSMNGGSKTGNSNYFGDGLENWIKVNGYITIKDLLTGLEKNIDEMKEKNIDEMKEKNIDEMKEKKIDEMKEKLKAILYGADEVLNKTIKGVADENKEVLREYLAKHKSPSPPRASPKTADKNPHRRMRGPVTQKNKYTPRVRA
jgi:hypothetical protein